MAKKKSALCLRLFGGHHHVLRQLKAGYRTLLSSKGRTPAMQTLHDRPHASGRVLSQEGECQRVPLVVQFSDLD